LSGGLPLLRVAPSWGFGNILPGNEHPVQAGSDFGHFGLDPRAYSKCSKPRAFGFATQVPEKDVWLLSVWIVFKEENALCWNFPRGDFWPKKGGGSYHGGPLSLLHLE